MIKKALLCIAILSTNAYAGVQEDVTMCTNASNLAETVMYKVQQDVPYDVLIKPAGPDIMPLVTAVYTDAMQQPRMRSDDGKNEQLKDFKHTWFNVCMKDKLKDLRPY